MNFSKAKSLQFVARLPLFLIPLAYMVTYPWIMSEVALWTGYGKHLWADPSFLFHDNISILATDNNITCAWLPSLIYYGLYRTFGLFAVVHFHHLILLLILAWVYHRSIFQSEWPWKIQARLAIYAFLLGAASFFTPRPALIAFLFFVLSFSILDAASSQRRKLTLTDWASLIVIQILWTNFHGTFVVLPGMIFWTLLFSRERSRKDIVGFFLTLASTLINPFTWRVYWYVWKTGIRSKEFGVSEWVSIFSLDYPLQFFIFWSLVCAATTYIWYCLKKQRPLDFLGSPFAAIMVLAVTGIRNTTFCFFALPIFLADWTDVFRSRPKTAKPSAIWGLSFISLVIAMYSVLGSPYFKFRFREFLPQKIQADFDETSIPKLAAQMNGFHQPKCAVLNNFSVGAYLMMATPNPLLIDSRVSPFTEESIDLYKRFMNARITPEVLEKSKACFAILNLQEEPQLIDQLKTDAHFVQTGVENEFVLLVRSDLKATGP